jgi:hypothetical protein
VKRRLNWDSGQDLGTWTNYSDISTITGWSSFTTKSIRCARTGNLMLVNFDLRGTSDNTATSFTVPYTADIACYFNFRAEDNGGSFTSAIGVIYSTTSTVLLYSTLAAAAWTASGTKMATGHLVYWAA